MMPGKLLVPILNHPLGSIQKKAASLGLVSARGWQWLEAIRTGIKRDKNEYLREWRKRPQIKERYKEKHKLWRNSPEGRAWRKAYNQRPETKAYFKRHNQRTRITTRVNGKAMIITGLNKRPRPDVCEICGKEGLLGYHHWNGLNPNIGIWLCPSCHFAVGVIDENPNFAERYFALKKSVENECESSIYYS